MIAIIMNLTISPAIILYIICTKGPVSNAALNQLYHYRSLSNVRRISRYRIPGEKQ